VKQIYELPILVVILGLAWLPIAQAQQSDAPKVEVNAATDLEKLRTMSEEGDPEAQYQLAEIYRIGFPVEQDHAKAIELYNRSAGRGYAASQFRLGELYEEGDILDRDLGKAIESYRQAAEQSHSGAQYALAHIYHLGSGVTQDMAAAMVWYRKAALQGDEWSQLALGDQYRIGLVVPRDLVQSTEWYRKAAERGNIFAQFEMGNAYRYGSGIDRDVSQAMGWYRMSSEAGNPSAKLALTELQAGDNVAESVTAQAPGPEVPQDAGSDVLTGTWEAELASSKTVIEASETDHVTIPMEADQPTSEETILTSETLEGIETPQRASVKPQEATAKIKVATAASASVTPKSLVRDVDDLTPKATQTRDDATVSVAEDAREKIYNRIMALVSDDTIAETTSGDDLTDLGQKMAYRSYEINKTLAVCIDWNRSGQNNIFYAGWWATERAWSKGESKRVAMQDCLNRYESEGCQCQVVDQNDENVLEVPPDFLARYTEFESSPSKLKNLLRDLFGWRPSTGP
jgi:TPR repeat protein